MSTENLLIEIGTEELPPKALRKLATAFAENFQAELEKARATLEEIETSALIINVVDASDPRFRERTDAVNDILESLHLDSIPRLIIFNKLDRLELVEAESFRSRNDALAISALTGEGTENLVTRIGELVS